MFFKSVKHKLKKCYISYSSIWKIGETYPEQNEKREKEREVAKIEKKQLN